MDKKKHKTGDINILVSLSDVTWKSKKSSKIKFHCWLVEKTDMLRNWCHNRASGHRLCARSFWNDEKGGVTCHSRAERVAKQGTLMMCWATNLLFTSCCCPLSFYEVWLHWNKWDKGCEMSRISWWNPPAVLNYNGLYSSHQNYDCHALLSVITQLLRSKHWLDKEENWLHWK